MMILSVPRKPFRIFSAELLRSKLTRTRLVLFLTILCYVIKHQAVLAQDGENPIFLHKQRKVGLELIGASYRSETPIRKNATYIFHGGLQYSFMLTSGNVIEKYYSSLDAVIASGFRYYYKILPTTRTKGQNIGRFLELDLGIKSGSLISKNMYYPAYVYLRPHWGTQFSLGEWGSMEFAAGLTVGSSVIAGYRGVAVAPNLQLRLSYLLK